MYDSEKREFEKIFVERCICVVFKKTGIIERIKNLIGKFQRYLRKCEFLERHSKFRYISIRTIPAINSRFGIKSGFGISEKHLKKY